MITLFILTVAIPFIVRKYREWKAKKDRIE